MEDQHVGIAAVGVADGHEHPSRTTRADRHRRHTSQKGGEILDLGHLKCIRHLLPRGGLLTALDGRDRGVSGRPTTRGKFVVVDACPDINHQGDTPRRLARVNRACP